MDMVRVNGKEIMVVEYNNQRVLLTEQVADVYECEPIRIQQNYNRNQERFEEGTHYVKLEGEELKKLRLANSELQISPMVRSLMLWTRRGASRHCKMLDTPKAWDMFDCLEENYFNPPKQADSMGELDMIIKLATLQKQNNERLTKVENSITTIRDTFAPRDIEEDWRKVVKHYIDRIVEAIGGENKSETYSYVTLMSYDRLTSRGNVNLKTRLNNARKNYMKNNNATESEAKAKVKKIHVIQKDKRIADIYLTILKEMAIQYGIKA